MNQRKLSIWLRVIAAILAAAGLLFFTLIVPRIGLAMVEEHPEMQSFFWPWLICAWVLALPCFAALVYFWLICRNIGKDASFSPSTGRYLMQISRLALVDCVLLLAASTTLFCMNMFLFLFWFGTMVILLAGLAVAAVAAVLSHWVMRSCALQDENSLTI